MNFDGYSDCGVEMAVDLVNSGEAGDGERLGDLGALREFLSGHAISRPGRLTAAVLEQVQALRSRLRAVFGADDELEAADLVNALLVEAGALPQLSAHDGEPLHLHFSPPAAPLVTRLTAECAMGLAAVLRTGGFARMSTCADDTCDDVFVDLSRNRSRRFCSPERCGNRSSVAAHRARRRALQA